MLKSKSNQFKQVRMNLNRFDSSLVVDFHQFGFLTVGVKAVFEFLEQIKGSLK